MRSRFPALIGALFLLSMLLPSSSIEAERQYALIELQGSVNPIIAEHIVKSIEKANSRNVELIIIKMDTPGGLMNSMREIIKAILSSKAPVVVFAAPKGAQAASAGGYIMLSAHIAAMAPGTEIGAMHPVSPIMDLGSQDDKNKKKNDIMAKKILNDTIAYGKSLAQKRGRNVNWTVRAIKEAISSTYIEAYRLGVIDLIAEDMNDLLKKINGRKVAVNGGTKTINTTGLNELVFQMDWKQKMLNFFADPQVVFLLLIISIIGIGMEFKNPGMIIPGSIGAISFIIFLMAVRVLPINIVGLLLILLAIALFIMELYIISYGFLTLGGIVSFVLGSLILFDSPLPGGQIPLSSIIAVVVLLLLFFFVVVKAVVRVHKGKVRTGTEGIVGETGYAMIDFDKEGKVYIHGEIWNAVSAENISKDDRIEVIEMKGMELLVKKKEIE